MSQFKRLVSAIILAGVLSAVVGTAAAHEDHSTDQWPMTCVDLNDIVEEHLGNPHNVGIYQRTFGDQAEAACQNDHGNDVRAVFGWAIADETGGQMESAYLELDWPTTCVELNDIVEGHLGNEGNVAIYQNTFGDHAEAACQNDHREDVRSVFAWAIPVPTPEPTPLSTPAPRRAFTGPWYYRTAAHRHDALISSEAGLDSKAWLFARCDTAGARPDFRVYLYWFGSDVSELSDREIRRLEVIYRFHDQEDAVAGWWDAWRNEDGATFIILDDNKRAAFARQLMTSPGLHVRLTKSGQSTDFYFGGHSHDEHPVITVMRHCGESVAAPPAPPALTPSATQESQVDLVAMLETLGPAVAQLRGLPQWDGEAALLTRNMLRERLEMDFAEAYPSEASDLDQLEWELLGILSPEQDIVQLQLSLLTEQIGGFYDPDDESMVVVGDNGTSVPLLVWTLAHEYVHALQDQEFDLDAIDESIGEENHDALLAFRALVEGDATLAAAQYTRATLSLEELGDLTASGDSSGDALDSASRALRYLLRFPYGTGPQYVLSLIQRGGWSWSVVNEAYVRLPASTEQVMHPEKYVAAEAPLEVDLPNLEAVLSPGWQEVRRNVTGEFFTSVLLGSGIDVPTARQAAAGWGGDAYVLYRNESGQGLTTMKFRWDTSDDLVEFWTALVDFLLGGGLGSGASEVGEATAQWSGSDRTARALRLADSVVLIVGHDPQAVSLAADLLSRG
ncbi:MAG: hypothetical protein OXG11_02900 [Chloroflexi bacterium]|nr:hypothetical protein [Chloroflexota bacterium]